MGIKGLLHLLQPYATRIEFPERRLPRENDAESETENEDTSLVEASMSSADGAQAVVIDGPALAYHAYYRALARRNSARNALEAMPAYAEVNELAQECLEILENHGIRIEAIFFDGALPKWKQDVRMDRLNGYLRLLEIYRSEHTSNPTSRSNGPDTNPTPPLNHFSHAHVPAKLNGLPALPFLVPSVIETLQSGRFKDVTSVISGEADSYCAEIANGRGVMVITSDSDLFVYQLGTNASVLLFNDIEQSESSKGCILKVSRYDTARIAQQLGLPSLQPLAFAKFEDEYRGINGCLKLARELPASPGELAPTYIHAHEKEYHAFLQQYTLSSSQIKSSSTEQVKSVLRTLDPRLSEWIHESGVSSECSGSTMFNMYLPVLIEDPKRASAWNVGKDIRVLAYSLLVSSEGTEFSTTEITRRGNRIASKTYQHLNKSEISKYLTGEDQELHQQLITTLRGASQEQLRWSFLGLCLTCYQHKEEDKPSPPQDLINALLEKEKLFDDWDFVHLFAQFQAALYSLRILQQCLKLHSALNQSEPQNIRDSLNEIQRYLQDMPSIADLFDAQDYLNPDTESAVSVAFSKFGAANEDEADTTKKTKKKKKNMKRQSEDAKSITRRNNASSVIKPPTNNMYSVLLPDN